MVNCQLIMSRQAASRDCYYLLIESTCESCTELIYVTSCLYPTSPSPIGYTHSVHLVFVSLHPRYLAIKVISALNTFEIDIVLLSWSKKASVGCLMKGKHISVRRTQSPWNNKSDLLEEEFFRTSISPTQSRAIMIL